MYLADSNHQKEKKYDFLRLNKKSNLPVKGENRKFPIFLKGINVSKNGQRIRN